MKTTVLFALFVAFLANPPPTRGPGQEARAEARQGEQPPPVDPEKIEQTDNGSQKPGLSKAAEKRRELRLESR